MLSEKVNSDYQRFATPSRVTFAYRSITLSFCNSCS